MYKTSVTGKGGSLNLMPLDVINSEHVESIPIDFTIKSNVFAVQGELVDQTVKCRAVNSGLPHYSRFLTRVQKMLNFDLISFS